MVCLTSLSTELTAVQCRTPHAPPSRTPRLLPARSDGGFENVPKLDSNAVARIVGPRTNLNRELMFSRSAQHWSVVAPKSTSIKDVPGVWADCSTKIFKLCTGKLPAAREAARFLLHSKYTWVCVFITAVPITKLFAEGGGSGGHVLRETRSRGQCEHGY
jgi:hypothetical protein